MPSTACFNGQEFSSFIVSQLPVYSDEILRDIRPVDALSTHIEKAQWDAFRGVQQVQDRFRNVKANTAKAWREVTDESCTGTPCDTPANEICWGYDRLTYGQEVQSWRSQLLCFDQLISKTKAVDHFMQIITDVLKPATTEVSSEWVRRKSLALAGTKILADASMTPFTGAWELTGDEEIFYTPSAFPTSKLTPEMLQTQIPRLRDIGYFGKWTNDPFWGGYDNFAELLTDDDTAWDLDKLATNARISDQWRFQMWNAAHEYYAYGMGGQIGNYMTHVDPNVLRFNKVGTKLQYVPRFKNEAATVGIGSNSNPDFFKARYQVSFIWHRFSWQMLVQQMQAINPLMPFLVRGLNGEWHFATNDLGQDCNGNTIANYKQNKGFFWADFRYGARPRYTEFLVAILHQHEPRVVYEVPACTADPGYPAQTYTSACQACDTDCSWTPDANPSGDYVLDASSVTCNDEPQDNGAISESTLADLVIALNADVALGALGTWTVAGTQITLTGSTCCPVLNWNTNPVIT